MSYDQRILLVEDDPDTATYVRGILVRYGLKILSASNAGQALDHLSDCPLASLGAMVVDVMLPYGSAFESLGGDKDPHQIETGIKLLEHVRKSPAGDQLWVAVITARAQPAALQRIESLLNGRGRLYRKPFDGFLFEHEMAKALHLQSQVPECLLPVQEHKE